MSANVESMFYTGREVPWHGQGVSVESAPTSADAIRLAGLDWNVVQDDVYADGVKAAGWRANIRDTDRKILGIVSDRYRIVQNSEAFAFTDDLIGGEVRYETAGSLRDGRTVWLLARLPDREIVGDKTETYLCFTNNHDGTGAIRACMTPVRVVCNNTLNLALSTARRSWSVKHTGNITVKLQEARSCLFMASAYMDALDSFGMQLANTRVMDSEVKAILDELFPVQRDSTDVQKRNVQKMKDEYMVCLFAPDIKKFRGTAWGAINAMADFAAHNAPRRNTETYLENNWGRIMNGHILVDRMQKALCR